MSLMFHHFLELLYHTFVEFYIDQKYILIDKVIFNCMLAHFFNFKIIRNRIKYFWNFHCCCDTNIQRLIDINNTTILYILNKKELKRD